MAWLLLIVAGLSEVVWASLLPETEGFRRPWPTVGFVVALVVSMILLAAAVRTLPVGTAYAIWVGIGAVGTVLVGQGEIDWRSVAHDDIAFAYVKATEGRDFIDRRFDANWRGAGAAGLDRGAYHFFTLCSPGADQARHFLDVVPADADALPPAVDLELAGNWSARPTQAHVEAQLDAFIAQVEAAWGRPLVLYVGDDWDQAYPTRARADRPLWHRRILRRPDVAGWTIWQVHGLANIDGIQGPVDLDIMRP